MTVSVERREALLRLETDVRACRACPLHEGTRQAVPGEGDPNAEILLIGEAPGQNEDILGRPFVGASGKFLTEMLRGVGLHRDDVFIANVVKHRPPANRDPLPDEIAACAKFLNAQIAVIDPLLVITLGRFSMARFFPGEKISRIHGIPREIDGRVVLPLYHPAAALHQGALRAVLEADFSRVPEVLAQARVAYGRMPPADTRARGGTGDVVQQAFELTGRAGATPEVHRPETRPATSPPRQLPLL